MPFIPFIPIHQSILLLTENFKTKLIFKQLLSILRTHAPLNILNIVHPEYHVIIQADKGVYVCGVLP